MPCTPCATRPVYRPYRTEANDAGVASGYRVTINDQGLLLAVEHFPTLAAARAWAEQVTGGRHYSISRRTVNERLFVAVGATCHEGWRFTGMVDIYPHAERQEAAQRLAA